MSPPPHPIVLYDADCGFCRWSLAKLLAWDRRARLRPLPLQEPEAAALLEELDEHQRMASWHLVLEDGSRISGGTALPALLRLLPGGRPFAAMLGRFPGALERGYRWVAEHRGAFGRFLSRRMVERATHRIASRS